MGNSSTAYEHWEYPPLSDDPLLPVVYTPVALTAFSYARSTRSVAAVQHPHPHVVVRAQRAAGGHHHALPAQRHRQGVAAHPRRAQPDEVGLGVGHVGALCAQALREPGALAATRRAAAARSPGRRCAARAPARPGSARSRPAQAPRPPAARGPSPRRSPPAVRTGRRSSRTCAPPAAAGSRRPAAGRRPRPRHPGSGRAPRRAARGRAKAAPRAARAARGTAGTRRSGRSDCIRQGRGCCSVAVPFPSPFEREHRLGAGVGRKQRVQRI